MTAREAAEAAEADIARKQRRVQREKEIKQRYEVELAALNAENPEPLTPKLLCHALSPLVLGSQQNCLFGFFLHLHLFQIALRPLLHPFLRGKILINYVNPVVSKTQLEKLSPSSVAKLKMERKSTEETSNSQVQISERTATSGFLSLRVQYH